MVFAFAHDLLLFFGGGRVGGGGGAHDSIPVHICSQTAVGG